MCIRDRLQPIIVIRLFLFLLVNSLLYPVFRSSNGFRWFITASSRLKAWHHCYVVSHLWMHHLGCLEWVPAALFYDLPVVRCWSAVQGYLNWYSFSQDSTLVDLVLGSSAYLHTRDSCFFSGGSSSVGDHLPLEWSLLVVEKTYYYWGCLLYTSRCV